MSRLVPLVWLVLAAGCRLAAADPSPTRELAVPDLIGVTLAEANARLHQAGFTRDAEPAKELAMSEDHQCYEGPNDGRVCRQSPAPGKPMSSSGLIQVQLGIHDPGYDVLIAPDVGGKSSAEAARLFAKAGFTGTPDLDRNASCKHDTVCQQEPAPGAHVARASSISIVVGP